MRTTSFKYLLLALLLLPYGMSANDMEGKYKKEKTIKKAYNVSANVLADIKHQYGTITVTTWNQNRAEIDVLIRVTGNNEREVNQRFDEIGVDFKTANSTIYARSSVDRGSCGNLTVEVNFIVKMPKSGSVRLENEYGHIRMSEIDGPSTIICRYGQVNIDALNNGANTVRLEYSGGSRIGFVNAANLHIEYSDLRVANSNKISLTGEYSNLKLPNVGELKFKCSYGEINADNAGMVTGAGDYFTVRLGTLKKLLNITADYSHINVGYIEKSVKNIAITSTYTSIDLGYAAEYPFDFEVYNKFQKLNKPEFKYTKSVEKDEDSYYKGYNKASGINKIFIKSEYAPVNFIKK